MRTRTLGPFTVSAIGLGAMPLSMVRNGQQGWDHANETVHAALDAGSPSSTRRHLRAELGRDGPQRRGGAESLRTYDGEPGGVVVARRVAKPAGRARRGGRDGSPEYIRRAVEASLRALDREVIDLYQWHRPDRRRLYGEVVETFAALKTRARSAPSASRTPTSRDRVAIECSARAAW
jgi:aryl-alcohol dehydrogenase-like predicted oxidoreductase